MNRRGFLTRALAGAAAVVAVGVAPKAVEAKEVGASGWSASITNAASSGNGLWIRSGAASCDYRLRVTNATASANRAWIYGNDPTTLHLAAGEFTAEEVNEWMAATGAWRIEGAGTEYSIGLPAPNPSYYSAAPVHIGLDDVRADGYSDGSLQATQRARSRIAEGLEV